MGKSKRSADEVLDGRYRLVERLGRGGFGDVWRAEELLPDGTTLREVALKLLHGSVASAPDWSAEARIIASLRDPGLVTVYAAGVLNADRPIPFVAMELLIGDNLGDIIAARQEDGRTLPWRRVLSWARQAAAALDVIHRAGVVHLDLKPANLFLADGAIKVLDFGIARQGMGRAPSLRGDAMPAPAEEDELATAAFLVEQQKKETSEAGVTTPGTTSHAVVGTPGFMAPEIFEEGEATPATDAYALAACIVQLTTGKLPQAVTGKPPTVDPSTTVGAWFAEVQAATVRGQIRNLEGEDLPDGLVALLHAWLALDPVQRGVERGGLRDALDAVWRCPHGLKRNPYRGLEPLSSRDEGLLFGREADVTRIARELVDHPVAVLYGEGAIGLSSLAIAGVVPDLARHFADDKHDWEVLEIELGAITAERSADDVVTEALSERTDDPDVGTVLLVEDLERLVTGPPGTHEALASLLAEVAAGADGLRIVATLDAEHVSALTDLEPIGEIVRPWLRFIGSIQPAAVAELVHGPARLAGVEIEGAADIVDELQDELTEDGTRLPLVSLALERWWAAGERSASAWRDGGGLLGRLREHAEAAFEAMDAADRAMADHVLLRTISVEGTSLPVAEEALLEASDDDVRLRRVIATLTRARLLMRDHGHLRLAHIGLATSWPRLSDLRLHDIDRLTFLEDLRNAARRWAMGGRIRKHLWPSDMLRELGRRREDVIGELDDSEREFVRASLRQRRVRRSLQGLLVVTLLFCVGLANYVNMRIEERERQQRTRLLQAQRTSALERMVTAARRTPDPYHRVALLSGAIVDGHRDPLVPIELLEAGRDLPPAEFMSLGKVDAPDFPWGSRWLVGHAGDHIVIYDFEPPAGPEWAPLPYRFRPHAGTLTDLVPLPFDTAVATRDQSGEVRVWRLREDGQVGLATVAPERCPTGPLRIARDAPVIACTTAKGIAAWDLREPNQMVDADFDGRVLDVAPDGSVVVGAHLDTLMVWNLRTSKVRKLALDALPKLAKLSDRDPVLAVVVGRHLDVLSLQRLERIFQRQITIVDPVQARWADNGVDLAICDYAGAAEWHYLRRGARAAEDGPLPAHPMPCDVRTAEHPERLYDTLDFGRIGIAKIGPRNTDRGWRLEDGRLITEDLVIFDPKSTALRRKLQISAHPAGDLDLSASAAAVFRDEEGVIWQVGDTIRRHDADGKEIGRWRGQLLARCESGRLLAWRKKGHDDAATTWEIFGARVNVVLASVPRRPGNVLGADPGCKRVFFQWLDGTISSIALDQRGELAPVESPGGGFVLDGYVYDARPSTAPNGLWLAMSSGAVVHVDGATGKVTGYGHATPRATAMADGVESEDLLFADDRGVILRTRGAASDRVILGPMPERVWEDIVVAPDGDHVWLSFAHGVTVVDLRRGEVVGELELPSHDRLARWDHEGSLLLWPYSYKGQPRGEVIPVGLGLATAVGEAASNISARLVDDERAVIRLAD